VIYMLADPGEVRVTVAARTPELLADLAKRSEIVRHFVEASKGAGR
jgi:hypothetical protein